MNSFTRIFQGLSNLAHDFWENCFHKPKLLLTANRLTHLYISKGISKIHGPRPPRTLTNSGETTSRYSFHELENAESFAKIIIIRENNYNR